jgi:hypothetical protein
LAIRDKVIVRMKTGGKPYTVEVKRPGGHIEVEAWTGLIRVTEKSRTGKALRYAAFNPEDVKSVEFEPGT